ncbi:MAG: SRPBCC family protein [Actinobacteria bacterium]|nr:SRPBCC family protein [Actinomycetota bacterium]
MAHLHHSLHIDAPVEKIDEIVGDPRQWSHFWVGMTDPMKVDGGGGPGTSAEYDIVSFGIRQHEITHTIEERHDPDGSTHWRWEFEGTTHGWLTCDHLPADGGTDITTEFEYNIPGSVFGRVVDLLVLERIQRRDFQNSLENIKVLAESAVSTMAPA